MLGVRQLHKQDTLLHHHNTTFFSSPFLSILTLESWEMKVGGGKSAASVLNCKTKKKKKKKIDFV